MDNDGMILVIGGGALGAICTLGAAWIKARFSKTKVDPQPLEVSDATPPRYVSCAECDRRHAEIDRRMAQSDADTRAILAKLDDLKRDNENYARRIHDRLDPVVQAVAANQELLKQHLEDHRRKP